MRIVRQPVATGIRDGRIPEALVPGAHQELAGQECGAGPVPILHDLQDVPPLRIRQRGDASSVHQIIQ